MPDFNTLNVDLCQFGEPHVSRILPDHAGFEPLTIAWQLSLQYPYDPYYVFNQVKP
jgi:hypothetical protein